MRAGTRRELRQLRHSSSRTEDSRLPTRCDSASTKQPESLCESTESERDLLIFEVRNLERMLVCTSGGGAQVRRRGLVATGRR